MVLLRFERNIKEKKLEWFLVVNVVFWDCIADIAGVLSEVASDR